MFKPFFGYNFDISTSTFDVAIIAEVVMMAFSGREVGIWVEITFPTTFPLSSLLSFDEPTFLSHSCDTFADGHGSLVGNRTTKSSMGTSSVLKHDPTKETIAEIFFEEIKVVDGKSNFDNFSWKPCKRLLNGRNWHLQLEFE